MTLKNFITETHILILLHFNLYSTIVDITFIKELINIIFESNIN